MKLAFFVCVYAEPDATAPADTGADTNAGAAGSVSAELGSDQRNVRGDHRTLHAAHRAGAGAPQQEEPHHRGQCAPDRLPGTCTHTHTHTIIVHTVYSYSCMVVCSVLLQFLQDVLDTLFSLLDDNIDKYGPLVFQSLVGNFFLWLNYIYK